MVLLIKPASFPRYYHGDDRNPGEDAGTANENLIKTANYTLTVISSLRTLQ